MQMSIVKSIERVYAKKEAKHIQLFDEIFQQNYP